MKAVTVPLYVGTDVAGECKNYRGMRFVSVGRL